jgi:hypothetical protein
LSHELTRTLSPTRKRPGPRKTPPSVLLFILFGVVAAFCVPKDVSPQALLTENIEDLQESFALKGLADPSVTPRA